MKFDEATCALTFRDMDEATAFHLELTGLIRQAMFTAGQQSGPGDIKGPSREVMKEFARVMRALNAMRQVLPRHGE